MYDRFLKQTPEDGRGVDPFDHRRVQAAGVDRHRQCTAPTAGRRRPPGAGIL